MVTDKRGTLIQISPSALSILGYQPDEVIGQDAGNLLHPDDLELTRQQMRLARRGGQTRNFDCRYMHKDGHAVPLSWTGVWSEQDQHHFFIGRDMTEAQRIEAQLRQAQKMEAVGQLTGGLAHDFNNILMIILANIEMIEEETTVGRPARPARRHRRRRPARLRPHAPPAGLFAPPAIAAAGDQSQQPGGGHGQAAAAQPG